MLARVPVLAANEGGPLETVVEGETGWLRDVRHVEQWRDVMAKVLDLSTGANGKRLLTNMGSAGRERVMSMFSKESMAKSLNESLDELPTESRGSVLILIAMALPVMAVALLAPYARPTYLWFWEAVWDPFWESFWDYWLGGK